MTGSVFYIALEKRFTDSPEAVLVDITSADLMLIRNNETGVIMRLPFSVLAAAVSGALTGYMKSDNNLSDVQNAGTARTNLGATTLGGNLFTIPNPGAVRFPRFNADNTVSALDAASFRAAIGAGTSSTTGTVTSVGLSAPTGFAVSGSPVTGSGTLSFSFSAGYSLPSNTAQAAWDAKEPGITAGSTSQYWRGDKSWQTLNKSAVGLGNVDNTSDANKPVSTAQQTALDNKMDKSGGTFTNDIALASSGDSRTLYLGPTGYYASVSYNSNGNLDITARSGYRINLNSPLTMSNQNTAASATSGSYSLPTNPAGFLTVVLHGTTVKIPYYNN